MSNIYLTSRTGELPSKTIYENGTIITVYSSSSTNRNMDSTHGSSYGNLDQSFRSNDHQHRVPFTAVTLDSLGEQVLTSDRQGNLVYYDLVEQIYKRIRNMGIEASQVQFSFAQEGMVYTVMPDATLRCYNLHTGDMIVRLHGHKSDIVSCSQTNDGKYFLSISNDIALIWDTTTWSRLRSLGSSAGIQYGTIAKNIGYVVIGFQDDTIFIADILNNFNTVAKLSLTEPELGAGLRNLACTDDGNIVIAGANNGCVYVWDVPSTSLVRIIDIPEPCVPIVQVAIVSVPSASSSLSGSSDSLPNTNPLPQILMLSEDGRLLLVELGAQFCTAVLELEAPDIGTNGMITSFSISQDGQLLVVNVSDGRFILYDVPQAKLFRLQMAMQQQRSEDGTNETSNAATEEAVNDLADDDDELQNIPMENTNQGTLYTQTDENSQNRYPSAKSNDEGAIINGDDNNDELITGTLPSESEPFRTTNQLLPNGGSSITNSSLFSLTRLGQIDEIFPPSDHDQVEEMGTQTDNYNDNTANTKEYDYNFPPEPSRKGLKQSYEDNEQHFSSSASKNNTATSTLFLQEGNVPAFPDPTVAQRQQAFVDGYGSSQRGSGALLRQPNSTYTGIAQRSQITGGLTGSETFYNRSGAIKTTVEPSPSLAGPPNAPLHNLIGRYVATQSHFSSATTAATGGGNTEETFGGKNLPLIPPTVIDSATIATHRKLASLIDAYGQYPTKYRYQAWRFLLRLPRNTETFQTLLDRGSHPAWQDLAERYPVTDRRLLGRINRVINILAHWSPVFGEVPFLPVLAFPFIKFFGSDDLICTEAVMTVLVNWGTYFVETLPYPPLPLLARVHSLLSYWDAPLALHLEACGVDPVRYAWPLLRSACSEVLTRNEWEILWDHLITNSHDPSLLLYAIVAYLRYFRGPLLHIKAPNSSTLPPRPHPGAVPGQGVGQPHGPFNTGYSYQNTAGLPYKSNTAAFNGPQEALQNKVITPAVHEICTFLRHQNPINVRGLLKIMYTMRQDTPGHIHPYPVHQEDRRKMESKSNDDTTNPLLWVTGPSVPPIPLSQELHRKTVTDSTVPGTSQAIPSNPGTPIIMGKPYHGPLYALPSGYYPSFLRYPVSIINYQRQERERIKKEEEEILQRKALAAKQYQKSIIEENEEKINQTTNQMYASLENQRVNENTWIKYQQNGNTQSTLLNTLPLGDKTMNIRTTNQNNNSNSANGTLSEQVRRLSVTLSQGLQTHDQENNIIYNTNTKGNYRSPSVGILNHDSIQGSVSRSSSPSASRYVTNIVKSPSVVQPSSTIRTVPPLTKDSAVDNVYDGTDDSRNSSYAVQQAAERAVAAVRRTIEANPPSLSTSFGEKNEDNTTGGKITKRTNEFSDRIASTLDALAVDNNHSSTDETMTTNPVYSEASSSSTGSLIGQTSNPALPLNAPVTAISRSALGSPTTTVIAKRKLTNGSDSSGGDSNTGNTVGEMNYRSATVPPAQFMGQRPPPPPTLAASSTTVINNVNATNIVLPRRITPPNVLSGNNLSNGGGGGGVGLGTVIDGGGHIQGTPSIGSKRVSVQLNSNNSSSSDNNDQDSSVQGLPTYTYNVETDIDIEVRSNNANTVASPLERGNL